MRRTTMRPLALTLTTLALLLGGVANAGTINMIVGNFDVAFDGATGEIFDFGDSDGGNLDTGEARTVSSTEFELDGVSQVLLMDPPDNLFADLLVTNLGSELTVGSLETGEGGSGSFLFGFDWFDDNGNVLRLGIDDISYTVIETGIGLNFFNFFATAKVLSQTLPGGLQYEEDVLLSFAATDVMLTGGQNGARLLIASGALTVTGEMVIPEPATAILLLGGLMGSAVMMRYRLG